MRKFNKMYAFIIGMLLSIMISVPVKADVSTLQAYYGLLPPNIQTWLVAHNVTIELLDTNSFDIRATQDGALYNGYLMGYTRRHCTGNHVDWQKIVIREGCEFVLPHEVGHAISNYNDIKDFWETQPTFLNAYEEERYWLFLYDYSCCEEPSEYFAGSFSMFITNPDITRVSANKTYDYMVNVVNMTY